MANTIIIKNSSTTTAVPGAGDLVQGELAVNVTDKKLFTKDSGGSVVQLNTNEVTLTGAETLTNKTITATRYNESVGTITGSTLDFNTGNVFNHSISANTTYVFSNPPASGTAFGFVLKVTVTGTVTITWPASVDWAGATAPDAPASGETDVYAFYTTDGGTTYYGFRAGDAMA